MYESLNIQLSKIKEVMKEYAITQSKIAEKIGMNPTTFKFKFNDDYPSYNFKPSEIVKIIKVLKEMSEKVVDIGEVHV